MSDPTAPEPEPSSPVTDPPARVIPDAPDPALRFRQPPALLAAPGEVWRARQLIRALAERELRALYKQAVLGVAWAVLTPVALMIVFTIFFQRLSPVDTSGVPYPLFVYIGLVAWSFFSASVSNGGLSLVSQMNLVNKIKCPREVFPLSYVAIAAFNTLIASAVLLVLFAINRFMPKPTSVLAVLPFIVQLAFTVGLTLVVASVTVYLRDLRHALPILLQIGLLATPVAYGLDQIPEALRPWYCLVNPMGPVIDSYRQTVLYGNAPNWTYLGLGALSSAVVLVGGLRLFRRLEQGFADVA